MKKLNVYRTNDKKLVFVSPNASAGWTTLVATPGIYNDFKTLVFERVNKANLVSDFREKITHFFASEAVNFEYSSTNIEDIHDLVLVEDLSSAMYHNLLTEVTPSSMEDTPSLMGSTTLKEHLESIAEQIDFPLQDPKKPSLPQDKYKRDPRKYDAWAHKVMKNKSKRVYSAHVSDTLYEHIKKTNSVFALIVEYIENHTDVVPYSNIMMYGPPASGKTKLVETVARYYDRPFAAITGSPRLEAEEVGGTLSIKVTNNNDDQTLQDEIEGDGQWSLIVSKFLRVAVAGGVLFLDEANNFSPATQLALTSFIDSSVRTLLFQGREYKVHDETIIFAAGNKGTSGIKVNNEAFENRFLPITIDPLSIDEIVSYYMKAHGRKTKKAYTTYVKFFKELDEYFATNHAHDNYGANSRVTVNVRHMDRFLKLSNNPDTFEDNMFLLIRGLMSSTAYTESTARSVYNKHSSQIRNLKDIWFKGEKKQDSDVDNTSLDSLEGMFKDKVELPEDAQEAFDGKSDESSSGDDTLDSVLYGGGLFSGQNTGNQFSKSAYADAVKIANKIKNKSGGNNNG